MAIAMVSAAIAFGVTAAIALFLRPAAPAPPNVVVQMPGVAPTLVNPGGGPMAVGSTPDTLDVPAVSGAALPRRAGAAAPAGSVAAPAAVAAKGPLDLHSLTQTNNVTPTDETGGESARAPGQCISEGQVQQVLGAHQSAIRRACWERNPSTKPTVNVSVSLTIGGDGSAQGVSASGDDPSVAKCIENDVRNWRFPAMGCAQRTNIPFKFVRQ
jgi:hypothetical protein